MTRENFGTKMALKREQDSRLEERRQAFTMEVSRYHSSCDLQSQIIIYISRNDKNKDIV